MPHTHQTTHLTHYILHMTHTLHTQQTAYLTHRTYIMHDYSYNLLITCESHHEPFINPSGSISNLSGTHQESSGTNQKPIRNCQEPSETFRKYQKPSRTHQEPGVTQMLVLQIYRVDHLTGSPPKNYIFLPPFVLASPLKIDKML